MPIPHVPKPPYCYAILDGLVEQELSVADLIVKGFDRATVKKVENLLYVTEFKRFQAAPGTRLTRRAFWMDRRYPIANRWRDEA
jgi:NAD+ synthase